MKKGWPISSLHRKITVNSFSNVLRYVIYIGVTFLLTPFVIRSLGNTTYGLWVVVLSVVGYAGILEMGVQTAVIKLVAQYHGKGADEELNTTVASALLFFATVGMFCAFLCWGVATWFTDRLVSGSDNVRTVRSLIYLLGIDVLFVFPNYVFTGIVYGLQRYHAKNLIDVGLNLLNAGLIWILLSKGYGIFALAVVKTCVDATGVIATYWLCKKVYPALRIFSATTTRGAFRELFTLGGKIFSSATLARIANNAEPLLISSFLSTAWTAIFSVPRRLVDYLREISWAMSTGFMPMFSEVNAREGGQVVRELYFRYTRYMILAVSPVAVCISIYGEEFIRLWISPEYAEKGKVVIVLLGLAFLVENLQPLVWRLFIGVGQVNMLVKVSSLGSVAYILLVLGSVRRFGIIGVAASGLVVSVGTQFVYFIYSSRHFRIPYYRQIIVCQGIPVLVCGGMAVALVILVRVYPPFSYAGIATQVAGGFAFYGILLYAFVLKREEKVWLADRIGAMRFSIR
ncbi:MAG: lipopolysaccharide biosynthesis protein [Syntrophales bacterium]